MTATRNHWLAGLLAAGLLAATIGTAWGQNDWWCGPNDQICTHDFVLHGGRVWCEPITTPAARAMCPLPPHEGPARRPQRVQPGGKDSL